MTKYTVASQRRARTAQRQLPAIWRGIGCLLILFVPVFSYALASIIVQAAVDQGWPLPYQLMGFPVVSPTLWKVSSLSAVWGFIQSQPNLYAVLLFTILLIVVVGAVISFVYALVYKFTGPSPLGPYDMPPIRTNIKKYKR